MRLLITGVAGFIGSHTAERLLTRGDQVVGVDNFDETLYPATLHERQLQAVRSHPRAEAFTFHQADLADEATLSSIVERHQVDAALHLGALAGVRPSLAQPLRYARVNVHGTLVMLEAMRRRGISRMVFASSSSIYGARTAVPFREDDPASHPASPYAATKRAGELLCETYASLYGMTIASLRFFTVYGPRQRPEMAIHKFAAHIVQGRPIPFYGDGLSARDYTYIDDIVDGIVSALDSTAPGGTTSDHRIYNLGGARATPLRSLVGLLEQSLGRKAIIDQQPDQPGDVPLTCADLSRSAHALGYQPLVPIEEGIARFCAWFQAQEGPSRP